MSWPLSTNQEYHSVSCPETWDSELASAQQGGLARARSDSSPRCVFAVNEKVLTLTTSAMIRQKATARSRERAAGRESAGQASLAGQGREERDL